MTRGAPPRRVLVVGASGYIGQHVTRELVGRGHDVVAFVRRPLEASGGAGLDGAEIRLGEVTSRASIEQDALRGERFDVVVSCLASRSGAPGDAWRIEHRANLDVLEAARATGALEHFVLLSAICLQRPRLAFQHAKLAFERDLKASGIRWSIVRPTAFFKSLGGQVERVRAGSPYVLFGQGELTACKPIGEGDLARFMADCLDEPSRWNRVLPIGGPGPAITPRAQGELLFAILGRPPRFRSVPVALLDAIVLVLSVGGLFSRKLRDQAERARIGRYYATESMLALDPESGRYDPDATPETGTETLRDFYERVLREGMVGQELGEHAVFARGRPRA